MNQEKIGKFIAKIRKEKNITQQELANKLNVTDRAIGNWENGRRMPDYSIIKDLCNELEITINELFAGEKIPENQKEKQFDKTILNFLKINNVRQKIYNIILIFLSILFLILIMYIGKIFLFLCRKFSYVES